MALKLPTSTSMRRSWTGTRAASENRIHIRAISTTGVRVSGAVGASMSPVAPSSAPTATNSIGAVRSAG